MMKNAPGGCTLRVFRWREKPPDGEELHDRFIITQLAGVSLGAGTAARDSGKVRVALISEKTREHLWEAYAEGSQGFQPEGDPVVFE